MLLIRVEKHACSVKGFVKISCRPLLCVYNSTSSAVEPTRKLFENQDKKI